MTNHEADIGSEQVGVRFETATHIPFDQAVHFEREGFTGDILVPKEAALGFTALQVNVDGEHPLKEIGKGNTRSYFVVEGEGTFVLDGDPKTVSKGDLIVVPAGSQYEYQGVMTLFEFNVSPGNTFRDKKVESPQEPDPNRNPSDHHSAKLEREKLAHAIAEIIKRGYTLTHNDMKEIVPYYGYNAGSRVLNSPNFRMMIAANGAWVVSEWYRNREIFRDGELPREETDIADTMAKIDVVYDDMSAKRKK